MNTLGVVPNTIAKASWLVQKAGCGNAISKENKPKGHLYPSGLFSAQFIMNYG